MAIRYEDVYNTEAFGERVNQLTQEITILRSGSFFNEGKQRMQETLNRLKTKQQALFDTLGVKDIEDLNKRLREYREKVINLSGSGLAQSFILILEAKSQREYDGFIAAVEEIIKKDILNDKTYAEITQDIVHKEVMKMLNKGRKGKSLYYSASGFDTSKVNPQKFTAEQKREWKNLIAQRVKNDSLSYPKAKEYIEIISEESQNEIDDTITFSWYGISDHLTQKEAKEKFAKDPTGLRIINQRFKELILSRINDQEDKMLISIIVDHVLDEEPYAFFVGNNINEITGVLGEIQGLFYMSTFLRDKNKSVDLIWRGGKINKATSQKPHQDLLLNEKFGIQVKNTTKDILQEHHRVDFSDNTLQHMLSEKMGLSPEITEVFKAYYGTLSFNVPYHREDGRYLPGLNENDRHAMKFAIYRNQLENLEQQVETLLSLYATSLMYLDEAEEFETDKDANILFLIGGAAAYTAADILQTILNELEKNTHFRIKAKTNNERNIISALNDKNREPNYSNFAIENIYLTSSYLF